MIKNYFITEEIDFDSGKFFVETVYEDVEELVKYRDSCVRIFIDSFGGYTGAMTSILSAIAMLKSKDIVVETHVVGEAYSAASIIAASGTKDHRYIGEFSHHLVHWGSTGCIGATTPLESDRIKQRSEDHFDTILSLYKRYANIPKLKKMLRSDLCWLDAEKCLDYGLADHIEKL